MRYPSIAIALAMAACLGIPAVAQAAPCKGTLTYGTFYGKRMGGGYLEYINGVHNSSAKAVTFTMRVWGIHAPESAKAPTQTLKVAAGGSTDVAIAYGSSQYFGQYLQRKWDVSTTNNFPTLSLTDCNS
jgi:hypothetical protein